MDSRVKVYTATVIEDTPLPQQLVLPDSAVSQPSANQVYSAAKIQDQQMPAPRFATEVLSLALNTKSRKILQQFEFTKSGALQIGEYSNGVSGDIRLTPNGITARDISGNTTFNLDGDTGDATFKGTVRASTFESDNLLTGLIDVGTPGSSRYVRIDGANNRILINDGSNDRVLIGYQKDGF